ncbi:MAG: conjugal transfer protein TraB [Thermoplasmatales archaeon]|nr:conjugal transfer protein TraB [Thermoplasmatales archaeon]
MDMLTIVGTGHVFRIADSVRFIVRQTWPDAVLVELDQRRYDAMVHGADNPSDGGGGFYGSAARYQRKMAESQGIPVGAEMLAAVDEGKLLGKDVGFIDMDAAAVMDGLWDEMPLKERLRYKLSSFKDRLFGFKRAERAARGFSDDSARRIEAMRRKYPTLVKRLVDDRDDYMAERIKEWMATHDNVLVVVGDAHVDGLAARLPGVGAKIIRLGDLMDPERLGELKSEMWNQ